MRNHVVAFGTGLVFAVGLGIAGMTQPAKVIGFLDFFGSWDPSLAMVMLGAVAVFYVAYWWTTRQAPELQAELMRKHDRLDGRLLGGAAIFGIGWGLGGFCPGPAVTSVMTGAAAPLLFMAGMLLGMGAFHAWRRRSQHAPKPHSPVHAQHAAR